MFEYKLKQLIIKKNVYPLTARTLVRVNIIENVRKKKRTESKKNAPDIHFLVARTQDTNYSNYRNINQINKLGELTCMCVSSVRYKTNDFRVKK